MSSILSLAPPNLVDLLLNLQTLQVVKLRLMTLELRVELVFASFLRFVSFEQYYSTSFVSCREVVSRMIELDRC